MTKAGLSASTRSSESTNFNFDSLEVLGSEFLVLGLKDFVVCK